MKKLFFNFVIIYFTSLSSLYALIEVDITRGNLDPLPIAVSPLHVDIKSEKYEGLKIKELGENISSIEIENTLSKHPSVSIAAVVAKPDEKWGEVPCAFIEMVKDKPTSEKELISFCKETLAGFKVPKQVVFCELPKTSTGKIQKFELRKKF